jgi:hypothetical protein
MQSEDRLPQGQATIVPAFADDVLIRTEELAKALRVSRFTVHRWKRQGYQFAYGDFTTLGHFKEWLRTRPPSRSVKKKPDTRVEDFLKGVEVAA